jgi:zinc dependent phospholipase C
MGRLLAISRLAIPFVLLASISYGYSVLTHEAIIDSLWDTSMRKVLLARFPDATPEALEQAHAHAYGGCILQDMGYYPLSSRFFSDLTHYVRSGDFIEALLREAQDLNEYAFALGALAHYAADSNGHRLATNRAVPMLYPKLRRKFGAEVTYWDDPLSHLRTEFAFDVMQVASGRYAPDRYRSFIGFQVSKAALERAFLDTYGVELKDIFANLSLALGSYRYSVGSIIPGMTRVAWRLKNQDLKREIPGVTRKKFLYNLSRASYEKEWGTEYHKPGLRTRLAARVLWIVPKAGPFKALPFSTVTPEVERMFMLSFNATVDRYRALLASLDAGPLKLPNENFDVGKTTSAGQYQGTDETYAKLVSKLAHRQFAGMPPELREDILAFYKDPHAPLLPGKKENAEWAVLLEQLDRLKSAPASD